MTYKTITGTYTSGFTLQANYTGLILTSTAKVTGGGVVLDAYGVVENSGTIMPPVSVNGVGVYLTQEGKVVNAAGGLIEGYYGVRGGSYNGSTKPSTLNNAGMISAQGIGVQFEYGGVVGNAGEINGAFAGVQLQDLGTVVNSGTIRNTSTLISTGAVDMLAGGRVGNYGLIANSNGFGIHVSGAAPTTIVNGLSTIASGEITGGRGGVYAAGSVTVINTGIIQSASGGNLLYGAVQASGDSTVINGSAALPKALIEGAYGIFLLGNATGTISNMATIKGDHGWGVGLATGVVTNGASGDTAAYIGGNRAGVAVYGANAPATPATLNNFGTIDNFGSLGSLRTEGVYLEFAAVVTNGSTSDRVAVMEGSNGVLARGGDTVTNWGTISTREGPGGFTTGTGVYLGGSDLLVNNAKATIEGGYGVETYGGGPRTIINFGTIIGGGPAAVKLGSVADLLEVEAGSSFVGAVNGGGGTLELASGKGTIASPFLGGTVVVSGLLAATTTFSSFGELLVATPTAITVSGPSGSLASGQSLVDEGTLTVAGALAGAGRLDLEGGTTTLGTGAKLTLADVEVTGAKTVVDVATSLTYAGAWIQTAGALSVATGDKATFSGKGDRFTGTLAGAGAVEFFGGSDTFSGLTLSAKSQAVVSSTITLSGVIDLTTTLTATTPDIVVASAGASLTGGGSLVLGNKATNAIIGASATAKLTNVKDTIAGAGLLGNAEMVLVNDTGGVIDADDSIGLTIATGAKAIVNAGLIESTGTGGLTIDSAIDNTGTIEAAKGLLIVAGAVTGAGKVVVAGGLAALDSTFTQNVTFTTAGGELLLAKSQSYKGTISGFATTPITTLDLNDIVFGATTKATYSGTTTSGVLTVTDGTHTSKIKLSGNYTASTFTVHSDGDGGTFVTDPTATAGQARAFISAMAGFGAQTGGPMTSAAESRPPQPIALLAPSHA